MAASISARRMGRARSQAHIAAAASSIWPLSNRRETGELCKLCEDRASYSVIPSVVVTIVDDANRSRLAHRLRDMQSLPYVVITNPHMSHVYELYYAAWDALRRIPEAKTVDDNDVICHTIQKTLREHLTVIPRLVSGILECQHLVDPEGIDRFMNIMLRSRISRRVIAEQHLALTETFHEPWHFPNSETRVVNEDEFVGEVFLKCHAKEVIERCAEAVKQLSRQTYGPTVQLPDVMITGDLDATLTYIPSHLEYIVGEIFRNSMQALIEQRCGPPAPVEVLIYEAPQHVIFRISDRGGGIHPSTMPHLWSFVKGPSKQLRLDNLNKVPQLSATLQEIRYPDVPETPSSNTQSPKKHPDSLGPFTTRPPDLRLGIGLPMSKVYAEYWAGSLEVQNLEGFGADVFLQISKLGNKNEQLVTRAAMDAL